MHLVLLPSVLDVGPDDLGFVDEWAVIAKHFVANFEFRHGGGERESERRGSVTCVGLSLATMNSPEMADRHLPSWAQTDAPSELAEEAIKALATYKKKDTEKGV